MKKDLCPFISRLPTTEPWDFVMAQGFLGRQDNVTIGFQQLKLVKLRFFFLCDCPGCTRHQDANVSTYSVPLLSFLVASNESTRRLIQKRAVHTKAIDTGLGGLSTCRPGSTEKRFFYIHLYSVASTVGKRYLK